jgi:hypothetical protein
MVSKEEREQAISTIKSWKRHEKVRLSFAKRDNQPQHILKFHRDNMAEFDHVLYVLEASHRSLS